MEDKTLGPHTSYLTPKTKVVIPPINSTAADKITAKRNVAAEYMREHRKSRCKREYDYHQKALVENLFSRCKTIYAPKVVRQNKLRSS